MSQAPNNSYVTDDIKLTDVIRSFNNYSVYVFKKFWIVIIGALLVGLAGYFYATLSDTKYQANASFNVVDSKGMSGLGGLLGSFGLASFGGSTSNDVLAGIIQSRQAIKSAFLTEVDYKGEKKKLIDIYLDTYEIREEWQDIPDLKDFQFKATTIYELTRKEDSLLNLYWNTFVEDYLEVEFEVLEGVIKASVKTYSYEFSKGMLSNMLFYSSLYFTDKQTKAELDAYNLSQYKVDSIAGLLAYSRLNYAKEQNKSPFISDATDGIAYNRLGTDVANLTMKLSSTREALDAAKTALMQSTPVINIIDHPDYSTDILIKKWFFWTVIGALVGTLLTIIILLLKKAAIDGFANEKLQQNQVN